MDAGPWAENNYGCDHHKNNPAYEEGVKWYTEENQPGFMREPSNAFSALAFLWVSFYLLLLGVKDSKAKHRSSKAMPAGVSYIFAITNFVHFLGCFLNHSSRRWECHVADVFGMQLIVWTLFFYSIIRQLKISQRSQTLMLLVVVVAPTILLASLSRYDNKFCEAKELCLMATLFTALLFVNRSEIRNMIYPIIALGLGVGFQIGDKAENEWINPGWPVHGHAIWHVATAISMLLMYLALRDPPSSESEEKVQEERVSEEVPLVVA